MRKKKKMAGKKTKKIVKRPRKARIIKKQKEKAVKKIKKIGKVELKEYKNLLLKEKERITGEIQHITKDNLNKSQKDASGDISGYAYHMADVATDNYDRDFSLGIAGGEGEILCDINDALERIEDGSYGSCLECEEPIAKKRLRAVPYTKYCIKCQKLLETKREPAP